jgi:hypothetical protein
MKKSVIVCLLVITLIISNTPSVRAEPITLTVMAIAGVTAVALSAAADIGVHNEMSYPAIGERGDPKELSNRSGNEGLKGKNQKQDKRAVSQNITLSPMPQ